MKLLNCLECNDILQLTGRYRACRCKKSRGKYLDEIRVEYKGPCRILGIAWNDYERSKTEETKLDFYGNSTPKFPWFVIVEGQNIKKVEE